MVTEAGHSCGLIGVIKQSLLERASGLVLYCTVYCKVMDYSTAAGGQRLAGLIFRSSLLWVRSGEILCQAPMMMMMMILIYVQGELVKLAARDLPKGIGTC
jgi:hypothetical protein